MSLRLSSALACLLLASTSHIRAEPVKSTIPATSFTQRTLPNGLQVIAIRDKATPNVTVSMWYEVGSKHDPAGRSGFAHLFEHILSRKTQNMPYNIISKLVDDVGGTRNASTWYDRTNYYEVVPAEYLERMLWTHAERMARPVIDQEVFNNERNVVKEELRQRVLAPPYGRLTSFVIGENVYNVLPHRRPTIGSIADLDSATLADARAFHEAYYGPDTATLIVAGNFEPAQLNSLVDKYFRSIGKRARPTPLKITARDLPLKGSRLVVGTGPNVPLPVVGTAYQMPGAAHADMAALQVLDAVLTGGEHNRLDTALVKTGLSTRSNSFFNDSEEQGFLALMSFVASGQQPAAVAAALDTEIERMRTSGPTDDEVMEARNELLSQGLQERETASTRAFTLGEGLVRTGDPRAADKRLAAVTRVTPSELRRVARLYLDPNKRLTLRYDKGSGDAAGWANPNSLPTFASVPPARRPELQLLPEGQRQEPPAAGAPASFVLPSVSDTRLGNGIRVVSARSGSVPLGTMSVLIRAGSAVDDRSQAGRAALAAAIAKEGTPTRTGDQIAAGLERLGASLNSTANQDGTILSITAPTANLSEAAVVLGDIVRNASFPQEDFVRERKRALDSLSVALKDPGEIASRVALPIVYGAAPYGTQAGGTPQSLAALRREDLVTYRQTWWRPELTSLVISGGLDTAQARQIAEQAFGDWNVAGSAPARPTTLAGAAQPGRTLVIDLPDSGQAAVAAVTRGVKRGDPVYYDALLANSILGVSSTGRLFTEVRTKRALSYGAYSQVSSAFDEGLVTASAQTKNESAAEVAKIFLDEFAKLAVDPFTTDDVANRQRLLSGTFKRQLETSAGLNGQLAGALLRGIEPGEAIAYAQRISNTSGPGASRVMARLLDPSRVSLVIVGDSAKFIEQLRKIRPNVEVVSADKLDLATANAAGS
jgi:zinc protease